MIRAVTDETLEQAAKIYTESWSLSHKDICTPAFWKEHDFAFQQNFLRQRMAQGWKIYLQTVDASPTGIVGLNEQTGEIGLLYVSPSLWNNGYGRTLLRFALERMRGKNEPFLRVLSTNERAAHLYGLYGFGPTKEQRIVNVNKQIYECIWTYRGKKPKSTAVKQNP